MALTPADKLLRFVSPKPDFIGDDGKPTWRALEPSSEDKLEIPVRVSVWNLELCAAGDARAAWSRSNYAEFTLLVGDVLAARDHWSMSAVRVVEDPLVGGTPADRAHCGIEGLGKQPGEGKSYGARLSFLTSRLRPFRD
jgi:hypothetical protein